MFDSPIFETVLSLTLLMLVFSILVSCIQEGFVTIRRSRGKMLEYAIREVLNDQFNKDFAHLLYQHPQIDLLKQKQGSLPSYIDNAGFASALVDLIAAESTETIYQNSEDGKTLIKTEQLKGDAKRYLAQSRMIMAFDPDGSPRNVPLSDRFSAGISMLHHSDLKNLLLSFEANTPNRTDPDQHLLALKGQIQNWYDQYMNRVTGWYKRDIRTNLFFASIIVTLVLNLNFITVSKTIYADSKLREPLVEMAMSMSNNEHAIDSIKSILIRDNPSLKDINIDALVGTELPIGWKEPIPCGPNNAPFSLSKAMCYAKHFITHELTLKNVMGWLLFTMGLTLGAPFWFDVMKKLVNVRNSGLVPPQPSSNTKN